MSIPRKHVDWKAYDEFTGPDAAFTHCIGMDPRTFHAYRKTRHRGERTAADGSMALPPPVNGTPASTPSTFSTPTALERVVLVGEPVSVPSVPALQDHEQRLAGLEAFMATMQQHPSFHHSVPAIAPEYTAPREWKKSGAEFTLDMPEQLRAYAKAHGLQVREVLDLALRRFLAAEGAGDA